MTTINKVGRRYYIEGTSFENRHIPKQAGCRWDPERRAWWTGKASLADEVVSKLTDGSAPAAPKDDSVGLDASVIKGRVRYKGKVYYLLAERRDGRGVKLCFRDGSKTFWSKKDTPFEVIKRYEEPRSINGLRAYAERAKKDQERYGYVPRKGLDYCGYPCPVSGVRCTPDNPCHDCQ